MKKEYIQPLLEVIEIEMEEVMAASGTISADDWDMGSADNGNPNMGGNYRTTLGNYR